MKCTVKTQLHPQFFIIFFVGLRAQCGDFKDYIEDVHQFPLMSVGNLKNELVFMFGSCIFQASLDKSRQYDFRGKIFIKTFIRFDKSHLKISS